jgi:hypothetical protein
VGLLLTLQQLALEIAEDTDKDCIQHGAMDQCSERRGSDKLGSLTDVVQETRKSQSHIRNVLRLDVRQMDMDDNG